MITKCVKQLLKQQKYLVLKKERPVRAYFFGKTGSSFARSLLNANFRITSGLTAPLQIRSSHTDIKFPDYEKHKVSSATWEEGKTADTDVSRKIVPYFMSTALTVASLYAAKSHLVHYVSFMAASAEVLALAKIEIKLSDIPEGKSATFKWRGKPLFVFHRSPESIATVRAVPISTLRDPQRDEDRVKKPEWLVVLGVCTHLGCVPIANAGDFGGYYCPCHGSHFDASGRARKGPAPTNLEVPHHSFINDDTLVVG